MVHAGHDGFGTVILSNIERKKLTLWFRRIGCFLLWEISLSRLIGLSQFCFAIFFAKVAISRLMAVANLVLFVRKKSSFTYDIAYQRLEYSRRYTEN